MKNEDKTKVELIKELKFLREEREKGAFKDITKSKQAEQAIQESESRFRELFDHISSGVAIYEAKDNGRDFIIKDFNRAAEKINNIKKQDIIGKSVLKVFPGVKDFDLFKIFQEAYKTGKPQHHPISLYKDQRITGWRDNHVYKLPSGEIVAVYDDITARKKAEEEIRLHAAMMNNVAEGVYLIGLDDLRIKWTNERFTRMFGYDPGEMVGKQVDIVNAPTEITPIDTQISIVDVLKETGEWHGEVRNIKRDGTHFWCYANVSLFDHPEYGKVIVAVHTDITERKQAEEKLKNTLGASIETMSKIVEVKDPYTAGHQQRVSQLTTAIVKELNLSPDKIEGMRIASLIHDIGKISVPTEILSKSTTLSDIEFSLIKVHSQIGYDILKAIDFSYPVANIVLQHHEKVNGSGYPGGLKGDEILLEAKIIGVADVVEAMSSHRPYRPALGINAALKEISQNQGILYDPEVVDACLKLFKEKEFKFK